MCLLGKDKMPISATDDFASVFNSLYFMVYKRFPQKELIFIAALQMMKPGLRELKIYKLLKASQWELQI